MSAAVNSFATNHSQPMTIDGETIEIDYEPAEVEPGVVEHFKFISATIGSNWAALPPRQHVNWFTSGTHKAALDISGDVYLTSVADPESGYVEYPSPRLLRNQDWFDGRYLATAYIVSRCCFYHDCPDNGTWSHQWNTPLDVCTNSCPPGSVEQYENFNDFSFLSTSTGGGLENGFLRLLDGHGGAVGTHVLLLEQLHANYPEFGHVTHFLLFLAYVEPGHYESTDHSVDVDVFPGDTIKLDVAVIGIRAFPVAKAIQHVSSDVAGTSPGFVDAGDLAALAAHLGKCASFCTDTGCQPSSPNAHCNWRVDLNADGAIDVSDIGVLATELDLADCELSKASDREATVEDILIGLA